MIKTSEAEGGGKSCRRKCSLLYVALSIKGTKASNKKRRRKKKKKPVMNKLIPPRLYQKVGFFSLTASLQTTKRGPLMWGKRTA